MKWGDSATGPTEWSLTGKIAWKCDSILGGKARKIQEYLRRLLPEVAEGTGSGRCKES